jgi:hypothetical protein
MHARGKERKGHAFTISWMSVRDVLKKYVRTRTRTVDFSTSIPEFKMDEIYSNSIVFGRFYATVILAVACAIAVCVFAWAWGVKTKNDKFSGAAKGQVVKAACEGIKKDRQDCLVDASFNVNGKQYGVRDIEVRTPRDLKAGDIVSLRYDPMLPEVAVSAQTIPPVSWANVATAGAITLVLGAGIRLYLANRFKFAASVSGFTGGISAFRT